jgi:hypothetical protein
MIEVAGVPVPRAAISRLAAELQHNGARMTGHRLAQAIDQNLENLALTSHEAQEILTALWAQQIDDLEPLRRRLLAFRNGNKR